MNLGDYKDGVDVTNEYTYDANGNMTQDLNNGISSISYNVLNLPYVVTVTGKGTITYTYNAKGEKFKKVSVDNTVAGKTITRTTHYLSGLVYETKLTSPADPSDYTEVLQFIPHEEGRLRFTPLVGATPAKFSYDYFLKDYLGNVRMVLTEEQLTDTYPAATMETANATAEELIYTNLVATRVAKPASYPNTPSGNAQVAKVNGAGQKIGPAILLKVMAGDKFNVQANSWWSGSSPGTPNSVLTDLGTILATALSGASGGKFSSGALTTSGLPATAASSFLATQAPVAGRPKAYLNWVLLNEQFKFESTGSGAEQVGATSGTLTAHTQSNLAIGKSGYLYIYVSNETPNIDVFFDMLQVTHIHGPIMEETHYYPFGLTMVGISSSAIKPGFTGNKIKFQGQELASKEFSDGKGLEMYEFKWRMHDPQIGRFWQIDPLADKYVYNSTYAFSENKVTTHIELEGLEAILPPLLSNNTTILRNPIIEGTVEVTTKFGEVSGELPKVDHHVITKQSKMDPVVQLGRQGGFKFEGAENRMPLEPYSKQTGQGRHGNHPNYNNEVQRRLDNFRKDNPNASPEQAAQFLRNAVKDLKETIQNNPQIKINDLFKPTNQAPLKDGIEVGLPKVIIEKVGPKPEPPKKRRGSDIV